MEMKGWCKGLIVGWNLTLRIRFVVGFSQQAARVFPQGEVVFSCIFIKWHNEGEKNTKYFLNLEKRHYKQGIISQLKVDENNFITSDQEILAEGESFFMNLYTSNRNIHNLIDTYDFFKHENDTVKASQKLST